MFPLARLDRTPLDLEDEEIFVSTGTMFEVSLGRGSPGHIVSKSKKADMKRKLDESF